MREAVVPVVKGGLKAVYEHHGNDTRFASVCSEEMIAQNRNGHVETRLWTELIVCHDAEQRMRDVRSNSWNKITRTFMMVDRRTVGGHCLQAHVEGKEYVDRRKGAESL